MHAGFLASNQEQADALDAFKKKTVSSTVGAPHHTAHDEHGQPRTVAAVSCCACCELAAHVRKPSALPAALTPTSSWHPPLYAQVALCMRDSWRRQGAEPASPAAHQASAHYKSAPTSPTGGAGADDTLDSFVQTYK